MLSRVGNANVVEYQPRRFEGEEAHKLLHHPGSYIADYLRRDGHQVNGIHVAGSALEIRSGSGVGGTQPAETPQIHIEVKHYHFEDSILESEWIVYIAIVF